MQRFWHLVCNSSDLASQSAQHCVIGHAGHRYLSGSVASSSFLRLPELAEQALFHPAGSADDSSELAVLLAFSTACAP